MTEKREKFEVKISYSHFSTDCHPDTPPEHQFKEGDRFISVSISGHNRGSGSPCRSREEAIEDIRRYIFSDGYDNGEKLDTQIKDVDFKDETDLNITLQEIFKQNSGTLTRWL